MVVEVEPSTLLAVEGRVMVLPPVPSCVSMMVPYAPANGLLVKLNVLFCVNVMAAFNPSVGFQLMVEPL